MTYDCVRCGESGELSRIRNSKNNQTRYVRMSNRLINSYLKISPPLLCPDCLESLTSWVYSPIHAEMFSRKSLRKGVHK